MLVRERGNSLSSQIQIRSGEFVVWKKNEYNLNKRRLNYRKGKWVCREEVHFQLKVIIEKQFPAQLYFQMINTSIVWNIMWRLLKYLNENHLLCLLLLTGAADIKDNMGIKGLRDIKDALHVHIYTDKLYPLILGLSSTHKWCSKSKPLVLDKATELMWNQY